MTTIVLSKKINLAKRSPKSLHKLVTRIACIFLTYRWYMYAVNGSDFAVQGRFELKNLIWIIPQAFLLWNLGLWLSTTLWGHKHRILTSIMILPALASPILLEFPYSTLGWLTAAIILWSYWIVLLHGGSK